MLSFVSHCWTECQKLKVEIGSKKMLSQFSMKRVSFHHLQNNERNTAEFYLSVKLAYDVEDSLQLFLLEVLCTFCFKIKSEKIITT